MSLSGLQQEFAQSVGRLLLKVTDFGFTVTLGEAWRTPEQAAYNALHHTGIAHSLHTERLAIDLNFFKDGSLVADGSSLAPVGNWWTSLGSLYRWGGNFKGMTAGDYGHFSISPDGVRA